MKNKAVFLSIFLTFIFLDSKAQASITDSLKLNFRKQTIDLLEGKSEFIAIELIGKTNEKDTIDIEVKIKETDATINKDFSFKGDLKFRFLYSKDTVQTKFFEVVSKVDSVTEKELILLELICIKNCKWIKKSTKALILTLSDSKSEKDIQQEIFAAQFEKLANRLDKLDKDSSDIMATLELNKSKVPQYSSSEYLKGINENLTLEKDSVKISAVEIQFKYGVASEVRAFNFDSSEVFTNHWLKETMNNRPRYGISFKHFNINKRLQYSTLISQSNPKKGILVNDLLTYRHKMGSNYSPSDTIIKLIAGKPKGMAKLVNKSSLNSYINFNIYTDLLGLLKIDKGNGIIQSDVSAKILLSTLPVKNKMLFWFNYLMPYAKLNRFENGFQNVPNFKNESFKVGRKDSLDRMILNQRKYFETGLKVNIFNLVGKFDNTYELNYQGGYGWFNRQGEIDNITLTQTKVVSYDGIKTNTVEHSVELRSSILHYKNFGINLGAMLTYQKILNRVKLNIENGGFKAIGRIESELFYYPLANSKDRIFLRTYFISDNDEQTENFVRVQFGYKAFFSLAKSNKK